MPNQCRRLLTVCLWLGLSLSLPRAWAQSCSLVETPPAGDCLRVEIDAQVEGTMRVMREGKWVELPVRAEARHVFLEKALGEPTDANSRVARYYQHSTLNHSVNGQTVQRSLALARRLLIVPRNPTERGACFCPHGPLTRDELELVAEHFNTLALIGLLPGRTVEQGLQPVLGPFPTPWSWACVSLKACWSINSPDGSNPSATVKPTSPSQAKRRG
jgi:hypothetical protein